MLNLSLFFFQGIKQEGDDKAYERKSDVYKDLVTLLKNKSPRFIENIGKQVMCALLKILHRALHVFFLLKHVRSDIMHDEKLLLIIVVLFQ